MALDKLKSIFGNDGFEPGDGVIEESDYGDSQVAVDETTNKMILLEPRAYSESQQIADYLKAHSAVVVNLKRVTPDQAKRIVDFLSGTLYAIGGDLQKLGGGIFLCTPRNVSVEGSISEDNNTKPKGKSAKDDSDEEFDW